LIRFAGRSDSSIQFVQSFYRKAVGNGKRHDDLLRNGVHRINVGEVDNHRLEAQMFEGCVGQIEVDAFYQHVGADHGAERAVFDHGCVVAYPFDGGGLAKGKIAREVFDQAEFAEGIYVSSLHLILFLELIKGYRVYEG